MFIRTAAWRSRLVTALCLLALVLVGCSPEHYPQTTLLPRGDFARIVDDLFDTTVWWAMLVFVLVEGALVYAIFRFRGKPGDPEPQQTHGNTTVEIIWTVIPALILAVIAVPTVRAIFKTNEIPGQRCAHDRGGRAPVVVGVPLSRAQPHHGQRAARAGGPHGVAPDGHRRRAAQLLGAPVRRQARRLPQPGDPALVQGREPGDYPGQCAEFCGMQHGADGLPGRGAGARGVSRPGWPTCRRCGPRRRPRPSPLRSTAAAAAPAAQQTRAPEQRFSSRAPAQTPQAPSTRTGRSCS